MSICFITHSSSAGAPSVGLPEADLSIDADGEDAYAMRLSLKHLAR